MTAPNDATLRQIEAADPGRSTWLAANAGSGKTRVLTDRVARLLLRGVMPQRILCLTYTKAAASEMQNRLFERLGSWAMKDDAALSAELSDLGAPSADPEDLNRARTLFARAIETPGGLKIQTIHSFCASILRRFPLEAGVSPQFSEMEERAAKMLREELIDEIADGPQAHVIDGLARFYTGEDFTSLTEEVGKRRESFLPMPGLEQIQGWFGLHEGASQERLLKDVFLGDEPALFERIIPLFNASQKNTDHKTAAIIQRLASLGASVEALRGYEQIFLTGSGANIPFSAKLGTVPTKACQETLGADIDVLNAFMQRVEAARERRLALFAAQKTHALYQFASVFLPAYEDRKMRRGVLDFDDLILRARSLLTDAAVAQWVLYRLDGGIDHILVDEAQDTSPEQWSVIVQLAQEFTAGDGARTDEERTIFVVGDLKQSIYSFQGADPAEFGRMRQQFDAHLNEVGRPLNQLSLDHSFRSSHAVLSLVDRVFEASGGKGVDGETLHIPFFDQMPGRVDLWPAEPKAEQEEQGNWYDVVDIKASNHETVTLAKRIARQIAEMIKSGSIPAENGEMCAITPGDFLILVRKRSGIFPHIIAACKAEGIAIAGADRLKLAAELAVKDIAATLRFLATPEDDLSLAACLRSPLFGWSEQALYDLAHNRTEARLWRALEHRREDFPQTHAILRDLRNQADFLRPYDLIERLLITHDGRHKLLARLGEEAEDGIDVLLAQALSYERSDIPSLTGFLGWLETDDVTVKRQMDAAGDRVRVMTIHGAKGLEAPIVILPETTKSTVSISNEVLMLEGGQAVWKVSQGEAPQAMSDAFEAHKQAAEEENMRLLYVAMTRAEKWLIVCAAGDEKSVGPESWYGMIEAGMKAAGAATHSFDGALGMRLEHGDWSGTVNAEAPLSAPLATRKILPDWARMDAPAPKEALPILAPSALGGAKAIWSAFGGVSEEDALRRGRQLHRLLEFLPTYPDADWPHIAHDLLCAGEDAATGAEIAELLGEAGKVLRAPDLAFLFTPGTLAEIDLAAALPEMNGQRMRGTIDRLVIEPGRVLAVDFKSNAVVPQSVQDVPLGLLRQMGAYASALAQIYPGRRIETALLWTKTSELMPLPHDIVRDALRNTPAS
ncbi:MAG: double-strand break repair helicase AddA [Paracoccaceae bacterium]